MTPMPPARLALAIQASLLLSFAGIASAQDAAPAEPTDQAQTLDTVTVTGTRIKKAELESQVPVQVLTREDIDRSGFTSVADIRSEEHTSELQSLMRISYAVFCLQQKKHTRKQQTFKQLLSRDH